MISSVFFACSSSTPITYSSSAEKKGPKNNDGPGLKNNDIEKQNKNKPDNNLLKNNVNKHTNNKTLSDVLKKKIEEKKINLIN